MPAVFRSVAEPAPGQLSIAIAMSEALLRLAETAEWDTFEGLQQERDALLRRVFEQNGPETDVTDRIDGVRTILALDHQTRELLVAAREETGRRARQTRKDHASLSVYQRVADGSR